MGSFLILFFRLLITQKKIAPVVTLAGFGGEEIAVQALHKDAIDHIPKDCRPKDRLGGTNKAAQETWKRAEEGLKRKNKDKAEKVLRIGFEDRGGKRMFYVADKGQRFEDMGRKRAGKREHLLLYSIGTRKLIIDTD